MAYFLKLIKSMKTGQQIAVLFLILLLLFLLGGCGYTQLKMPDLKFEPVNGREYSLLENRYDKEQQPEFTPMVGRFKNDINMYYPNYNTQYYPYRSYRYNDSFSSQYHGISNVVYPPHIETDLRIREQTKKYMPFVKIQRVSFDAADQDMNRLSVSIKYSIPRIGTTDLLQFTI